MRHRHHPGFAIVALTVVWASSGGTMPAVAQDDTSRSRIAPATEAASGPAFLREIQRSLKAYDERLTALANRMLAGLESPPDPGKAFTLQMISRSAQASYLNARLTREVAEIAITEYREGTYVQDLQTAEGEIRLAQSDLERARDIVQLAQRDANRLWAQLVEEGRRLRKESLELKKIALVDYTGPRRLKELEAEVTKARAEERVKEVAWQIARKKLEEARKASGAPRPHAGMDHRHRASLLMTRAIAIEGRLQSRLAEPSRQAESGGTGLKEIRTLTNEPGGRHRGGRGGGGGERPRRGEDADSRDRPGVVSVANRAIGSPR